MPHTFCEAAPEGRLGVRQLAAAFGFSLAILTHPKAQASLRTSRASPPLKKYAALCATQTCAGAPGGSAGWRLEDVRFEVDHPGDRDGAADP
jgi:hypothetical protein